MKWKALLVACFLGISCMGTLFAGTDFGVQFDYNKFTDADKGDTGLGGRLVFGDSFSLITSFDYYFRNRFDNMKFYEVNGNLVYAIHTESVRPYFGAGVGLAHQSFDDPFLPDSENKVGFNLVGGFRFTSPVKPFFEFRYVFHKKDEIFSGRRYVLTGGIQF